MWAFFLTTEVLLDKRRINLINILNILSENEFRVMIYYSNGTKNFHFNLKKKTAPY